MHPTAPRAKSKACPDGLNPSIVALGKLKIKGKLALPLEAQTWKMGILVEIIENKKAQPLGLGQEMEKRMPFNRAL